jgi:hypothetical protein
MGIQRPKWTGTVSAMTPEPTPSGGFGNGDARRGNDTAS